MTAPSAYPNDIVDQVMADHRLGEDDFFCSSRKPHLVAARVDAALRLKALGLSNTQMAPYLGRNRGTIRYYLDIELRARKAQSASDRWPERKMLSHLAPSEVSIVKERARLAGTSPELIMAQWVIDRARSEAQARERSAA